MNTTEEVVIPSHHQIADTVNVDFVIGGKLKDCQISAVKFTDYGKVLYDIHVPVDSADAESFTLIQSVDSAFVQKP